MARLYMRSVQANRRARRKKSVGRRHSVMGIKEEDILLVLLNQEVDL